MERIDRVKPLNLKRNVDISEPVESVRGNSLSMHRESFNSKINSKIRENFSGIR